MWDLVPLSRPVTSITRVQNKDSLSLRKWQTNWSWRETSMRTNDRKKMFWCLHNSRKLSADTPHRMFHKIVRHGIPIKQTKNKTRNKNWTINFFKLHNTLSLRHLDCKEFSLVDGNLFFFLVLESFKTTLTTASFFLRNLWFGVLQNRYHDGGY